MSEQTFHGNWFINGGAHQPGQLKIDKNAGKILLEIYSSETIEGYENSITKNLAHFAHDFLYGDGSFGKFTLYNCRLNGVSHIGTNFYKSVYLIEYVIYGILVEIPELLVTSGEFLFPGLASWYEGWQHSEHLENLEGNLKDLHLKKTTSLRINKILELVFVDRIESQVEQFHFCYKVIYNKTLFFKYETPVPFRSMLKDAITFLKLLEFSNSKPLNSKLLGITIINQNTKLRSDYYSVTSFHLSKNKEVPQHGSVDAHLILSRDKLGSKEALDALIIKWFQQDSIGNIIEYYLDANNWFQDSENAILSNVMFNNRFLNLIQGLEDYYRERHYINADEMQFQLNKSAVMKLIIDDKQLKQWFNNTFKFNGYLSLAEKLKVIVTDCMPEIEAVYGHVSFDSFPKVAAEFRNILSHGKNKDISLGQKLHLHYQIARLLLLICILKSLDQKDFKRLFYRHFSMDQNMQEIIQLQQIYHD